MDLSTAMTVSALLLMSAVTTVHLSEADRGTTEPVAIETVAHPQNISTTTICSCCNPGLAATLPPTAKPSSAAPVLGFLTVRWVGQCDGVLTLHHSSTSHQPVCSQSDVQTLLADVCQNKNGCEGELTWVNSSDNQRGYFISEEGAEQRASCKTMRVRCTVKPDVQGQLQAYKVVTALLCCLLLVLLLIRFTRPTVKALQKKLSDRRQSRWIGPTQSHSVSYHRGKTTVKNNDGEKRLSYPALERLAVGDSREPSSNRNSDYNF